MAIGALLMPLLIELVGLRAGLGLIGGTVAVIALAGLAPLGRIDMTVLAPTGLALLRRVPMLRVLPPPVLERLAQTLVDLTVPAGEVVFREGDDADRYWIIERGTAVVSIDGADVRTLGPGDGFGEIALLRHVPRTATVRAGDEELVLRGLDRDDFIPAVTGHGEAHEVADSRRRAVSRGASPIGSTPHTSGGWCNAVWWRSHRSASCSSVAPDVVRR